MQAVFNIDGVKKNAWLSIDNIRKDISFEDERDGMLDIYYDVKTNSDGKPYFEYKNKIYYIHDMEKYSMADLSKQIQDNLSKKSNKYITERDFILAMLYDGPWNTRFLVEMPVPDTIVPMLNIALIGDKTTRVPCKLRKQFNSEPHNGYKLAFEVDVDMLPSDVAEQEQYIATRRTYTSDIFSMIKSGDIEILPSIEDGKTAEQHIDEYFLEFFK